MPPELFIDISAPTTVVGLAALAILGLSLFRVGPRTVAIVQRMGSFSHEAGPGFHLKVPFLDRVAGRVNVRIQKLALEVEVEAKDGIAIKLFVAVHYFVMTDRAADAHYKLGDVSAAISSCVFDICKDAVQSVRYQDLAAGTDELSAQLKQRLGAKMEGFGYAIHKALVTGVERTSDQESDRFTIKTGVVVREEDLDAERDSARDVRRDAERDSERDDARDFRRDEERDTMRDAVRDGERDAERDSHLEDTGDPRS